MPNGRKNIDDVEWSNPANWHSGIHDFYVSPRDSRILVPKRSGLGTTINCGNAKLIAGAVLALSVITYLAIHHMPGH